MYMHVISQDGMIDVPYEMTAFHICNGYIHMNAVGNTGRGTAMAVYSAQEKALTAMKMMHQAYMECNAIYDKYEDGHGTVVTAGLMQNGIFRFPADDEVKQ